MPADPSLLPPGRASPMDAVATVEGGESVAGFVGERRLTAGTGAGEGGAA